MGGLFRGGAKTPAYVPPPAAPPAAQPATLASSSVASNSAQREQQMIGAAAQDIGTSGGAQGVDPASVKTAKSTLGGVS